MWHTVAVQCSGLQTGLICERSGEDSGLSEEGFIKVSYLLHRHGHFLPKILSYPFKTVYQFGLLYLPPCSISESVRWVREKLAMLAGEMEKRE